MYYSLLDTLNYSLESVLNRKLEVNKFLYVSNNFMNVRPEAQNYVSEEEIEKLKKFS